MRINTREVGDVVILDVKGKLELEDGVPQLKGAMAALRISGCAKVLLNLADCPYIDSAGLVEIGRSETAIARQGGSFKLMNLTKRIHDLLMITKRLTTFEIFDDETAALASFAK